jgi:hypothetical protein
MVVRVLQSNRRLLPVVMAVVVAAAVRLLSISQRPLFPVLYQLRRVPVLIHSALFVQLLLVRWGARPLTYQTSEGAAALALVGTSILLGKLVYLQSWEMEPVVTLL